jgi:hypothetical protein
LRSELVKFRNLRAKFGKPDHQSEGGQQAGQTEYDEEQAPVFRLSRDRRPQFIFAWPLNAKCKGSCRCEKRPKGKLQSYKLLLEKDLIRIGLPLPAAPALQFTVTNVVDPYNCTTNPATGLASPTWCEIPPNGR